MMSVSETMHPMPMFGQSILTSLFASMHINTDFCCDLHVVICPMMSFKNWLCGLGHVFPVVSSNQYFWLWYVVASSCVGWLHDQYAVTIMIRLLFLPSNSIYDQCSRPCGSLPFILAWVVQGPMVMVHVPAG